MKKKLLSVLIIFTMIFVVTGCNLETTEETTKTANNKELEQTTNTEEQKNNNDEYMDALRKCSVMEAADIYTTGVGKKSDNVFNDGRETCESWYKQWGEKDFLEAVKYSFVKIGALCKQMVIVLANLVTGK